MPTPPSKLLFLSLPASATERDLARDVLAELNPSWENKFSHTFTEAITTVLPECNLAQKKGKMEYKKERSRKRKIVAHINDRFSKNATMSVLAEAESLASYSRISLALSYERTTPQSTKSHSQKEDNMKWNVSAAASEVILRPPKAVF